MFGEMLIYFLLKIGAPTSLCAELELSPAFATKSTASALTGISAEFGSGAD